MSDDLPRVTEILSAVNLAPDLDDVPPEVLEIGRARGRRVHEAIEALTYGYFDPRQLEPDDEPYLDAWRNFLADSKYQPRYAEVEIKSLRWRYRGHPDNIGFIGAKRVLIDAKSGIATRVEFQLAGYVEAWNEERPTEPIHSALSVQLRRDRTYRLREHDMGEAVPVFQAAAIVYHAQRRS